MLDGFNNWEVNIRVFFGMGLFFESFGIFCFWKGNCEIVIYIFRFYNGFLRFEKKK